MIEIVMESPFFQEIMNENERRVVLGDVLIKATKYGAPQWVEAFLAFGADPTYQDLEGRTVLTEVTRELDPQTLDILLAHGAWQVGDLLEMWQTWSRQVAEYGGMDSQRIPSLLHDSACKGYGEIIRWESTFEDIDSRDTRGRTPLMVMGTSSEDYRMPPHEITQVLLEGGANVHAVDKKKWTALHYAVRRMDVMSTKVLLNHEANPKGCTVKQETPMVLLLKTTPCEVTPIVKDLLDLLLDAGANPFIGDEKGTTTVKMLYVTKSGRQYMEANPSFFDCVSC